MCYKRTRVLDRRSTLSTLSRASIYVRCSVGAVLVSSLNRLPDRSRSLLPGITGLRFVAALWVLLSHYTEVSPWAGWAHQWARNGPMGVTLFFILSGFVLTYNYAAEFSHSAERAFDFLRARFARVYPMYACALLLSVPIGIVFTDALTQSSRPSAPIAVLGVVADALMLQAFLPFRPFHYWNGPAWSLSAELVFYLVFPMFACNVLSRLRGLRSLAWCIVLCYLVEIILFSVVSLALYSRYNVYDMTFKAVFVLRFSPLIRVWEFLLGCLLGAAFLRLRNSLDGGAAHALAKRGVRDALVLTACVTVAAVVTVMPRLVGNGPVMAEARYSLLVIPSFALLVLALAAGPTWISAVLDRPLGHLLGESSYSLYIIQAPLLTLFLHLLGDGHALTGISSTISIIATIGLSVACFKLIEVPARRALRPRGQQPIEAANVGPAVLRSSI